MTRFTNSFPQDIRGVSFQVGNVLALVILTVLISGVVGTMGGFVTDTQKDATEQELNVIGNQLTAEIMAVDNLAQQGTDSTITAKSQIPDRVAGSQYTIAVKNGSGATESRLVLQSQDPDVTVVVPFRHSTTLQESTVSGDTLLIKYTDSGGLRLVSDDS